MPFLKPLFNIQDLKTPLLLLFLFVCCAEIAVSQTLSRTVTGSAGGTVTIGTYIISYNVGEPVADLLVNTQAGQALTVGFIQPDKDAAITSAAISEQLVLYPNPTTTGITFKAVFA